MSFYSAAGTQYIHAAALVTHSCCTSVCVCFLEGGGV